MALALRPYQRAAVLAARDEIEHGAQRVIVVAPTGAGKTVIASAIMRGALLRNRRVLLLAHRRELVAQAHERFVAGGVEPASMGVVLAGDDRDNPDAPVQVASIDTLRARKRFPRADLIVADECHHDVSKSRKAILERYPNAIVVGLTATPYRRDGRGLGEVYQRLVVVAQPRELIAQGHLVETTVYTVPPSRQPDLTGVGRSHGDYSERDLERVMCKRELVGDIVDHWLRLASDLRTVAFAVTVEHSRAVAAAFVARGIAAEHLDGAMDTDARAAVLARLERGETRVVVNCGVLCEGWDQPSVKCAVLARPTQSLALYLQQAGRICRPWEGARAVVLDHAGNALRHGLPQDDREFSLDGVHKRERDAPSVKTCLACYAVVTSQSRVCPGCGAEFPAVVSERDPITTRGGALAELKQSVRSEREERREAYDAMVRTAKARGWSVGWARHRYREKFGEWPAFYAVERAHGMARVVSP